MDGPKHRNRAEIEHHHRGKQLAHRGCAASLDQEQKDQQHQSNRDNQRLQPGIDHGEPLNRRQHRNGGRDHTVAIKQRSGENAQQNGDPAIAGTANMPRQQGDQRQRAALPLVIRAHQNGDILDRHDQSHRPENQADDTVNMQLVDRQ